ncbi:MAG: hypothetical protein HC806_08410 [Anaerolineae bacterium]|nr:hypothetical protein [Anaerolineae bacterium]
MAERLAGAGMVVVTYSWIAEEMLGYISLTPGMDLARLTPDSFGTGPTCPAIQPILDELATLNETGLLSGSMDLDRIFLGGAFCRGGRWRSRMQTPRGSRR